MQGQLLNNLGCASWLHKKELDKQKQVPEMEGARKEAEKEAGFISHNFKDAIAAFEKREEGVDVTVQEVAEEVEREKILETLLGKEGKVEEFSDEDIYASLRNHMSGKALANLSEYYLETEGNDRNSKNAGFWFRLGLKYFDRFPSPEMDRHLLLLGLFYASNKQVLTAEGLYNQALDKLKGEPPSYTKAMGLNLYGRLILKHHERRE
mmetsp:Transcript_47214/g.34516  ORF Transcript_47214/g.34516 Transcript_47214/m.34516 type:complete len:208 (-) Transcript_47214:63-686(-)